jgi:hypothetical protein
MQSHLPRVHLLQPHTRAKRHVNTTTCEKCDARDTPDITRQLDYSALRPRHRPTFPKTNQPPFDCDNEERHRHPILRIFGTRRTQYIKTYRSAKKTNMHIVPQERYHTQCVHKLTVQNETTHNIRKQTKERKKYFKHSMNINRLTDRMQTLHRQQLEGLLSVCLNV